MKSKFTLSAIAALCITMSVSLISANAQKDIELSTPQSYLVTTSEDFDVIAPQLANPVVSYTDVTFSIVGTQGAKSYEVTDATTKKIVAQVENGDVSAAKVSNLKAGKTFTFEVCAIFEDGTRLDGETPLVFKTKELSKVTGLKVVDRTASTSTTNKIKLSWTKSADAVGYDVYEIVDGKSVLRKTVTTTSASLTGIKAGSEKRYYVKAFIKSADGTKFYAVKSTTIKAFSLPQTPTISSVSGGVGKITVKYNKCVGAEGYKIYLATSKDGKYKLYKTTTSNSATISGLTQNKTYYIKVRSFKKMGNSLTYSDYTAVKSCKSYKYLKTTAYSKLYASASFSPSCISTVNAGKNVVYIGKSGRFYKVKVGGKTGYIYNKSFGKKANYSGMVTTDNLYAAADDIIYSIGTSPSAIAQYVTGRVRYYATSKGVSRESMACYALNYRMGACYNYAALSDVLLERAGYEHYIIDGSSHSEYYSVHNWNIYKTSNGWRHLDSCPFALLVPSTVCDRTDTQMTARGFVWDKTKYPSAK